MSNYPCSDCDQDFGTWREFLDHDCLNEDASVRRTKHKPRGGKLERYREYD